MQWVREFPVLVATLDPAQVPLPYPDCDERNFHEETFAIEDRHKLLIVPPCQVTLPNPYFAEANINNGTLEAEELLEQPTIDPSQITLLHPVSKQEDIPNGTLSVEIHHKLPVAEPSQVPLPLPDSDETDFHNETLVDEKRRKLLIADPSQAPLPHLDSEEIRFHNQTLLIEEERQAHFSIPSSFAAKYIWGYSDSSPPVQNACHLPDSIRFEGRAAIKSAFSLEAQINSVAAGIPPNEPTHDSPFGHDSSPFLPTRLPKERLRCDRPIADEPIVTCFCPYNNTAEVIDSLVRSVAECEGCDVLVLDTIVLAQGGSGPLGLGTRVISSALCVT